MLEKFSPRADQEAAIQMVLRDKRHLSRAEVGAGKAQPLNSLVLTKQGFIKMADVTVGTRVATPDGGEATVLGVYPQGIRPVYELTLKGGRKVRADADHLWTVATSNHIGRGQTVLRTTKELIEDTQGGKKHRRWFIEHIAPTSIAGDWKSSIPPYALGLLLGNGGLTTGSILYATSDLETVEYLQSVLPEGHNIVHKGAYDYSITTGKASGAPGRNLWLNELRRLGLMGHKSETKFIPQELLESSMVYRHELLQGLLDTDGSACYTPPKGNRKGGAMAAEYSSASRRLAEDVCWLVQSLGGTTSWAIKVVGGKDYYRVRVSLPNGIKPFRVPRKADQMVDREKYPVRHSAITSIEFVGYEQTQCIYLDSLEHEYVTDGFVRTHNTLIGVEAVIRSGVKVTLIVAPPNTRSGWENTFTRQGGALPFGYIGPGKKGKDVFATLAGGVPGVYFMSWQMFRMYDWREMPIDFIIYDEVHEGQNRKSSTHRAMKSATKIEYQLGLSATLAGNRVEGQWAIQHSLWPDKVITPAFWTWVTKYLHTELDQYAGKKIMGERVPGTVWNLLPSKSAFPSPYQEEPIVFNIEVDLLPAQRKLYDRFEKEAVVWLENHPLIAELPAVQQMRLRQICLAVPSIRYDWKRIGPSEAVDPGWEIKEEDGVLYRWAEEVYFEDDAKSTKADAVIEQIRHLYENGGTEPIIIFTHSRKFATMLTLQLQTKGYRARQFIGGMSDEERTWKRENFGKEFDIMVATQAAVGIGTDGIQDVCRIEFWVSLSDNRIHNKQAVGRCSRPGQKRTVLRYNFLARNTVEVKRLAQMEADQAQLDESYTYEQKELAA